MSSFATSWSSTAIIIAASKASLNMMRRAATLNHSDAMMNHRIVPVSQINPVQKCLQLYTRNSMFSKQPLSSSFDKQRKIPQRQFPGSKDQKRKGKSQKRRKDEKSFSKAFKKIQPRPLPPKK